MGNFKLIILLFLTKTFIWKTKLKTLKLKKLKDFSQNCTDAYQIIVAALIKSMDKIDKEQKQIVKTQIQPKFNWTEFEVRLHSYREVHPPTTTTQTHCCCCC